MDNIVILKHKSDTSGAPSLGDLQLGEVALNTIDGIAYMEIDDDGAGTNARIVQIGGVSTALVFIGEWDATTSLPVTLGVDNTGYYWIVSADGQTSAGSLTNWKIGDWLVSTGTTWQQVEKATARNGVADGSASLDGSGKIPISQIPSSVVGGMTYKASWDASTNIPNIDASTNDYISGDFWIVGVAGATDLDGITSWDINDKAIWDGDSWGKIDNTDAVLSVAGKIGNITLVKGDVGLVDVDNTTDEAKPVSTATQTALDTKEDSLTYGTSGQVLSTNATVDGYEWIDGGGGGDTSGFALKTNVLELDNTTEFIPNADYEPSTKKYVDSQVTDGGFRYQSTNSVANISGGTAVVKDTYFATLVIAGGNLVISSMDIYVTTTDTSSSVFLGIYSEDGSTLLGQGTIAGVNIVTGINSGTLTSTVTLIGGNRYWFAVATDSDSLLNAGSNTAFEDDNLNKSAYVAYNMTALPASIENGTTTNIRYFIGAKQ